MPTQNARIKTFHCNSLICLAYLFAIIANVLIMHGLYLAYENRNRSYLFLPLLGVLLIFFGAYLYRSGTLQALSGNVRTMIRNNAKRRGQSYESELSLNMLPQSFPNISTNQIGSMTRTRLVNTNHQDYVILPISHNNSVQDDVPLERVQVELNTDSTNGTSNVIASCTQLENESHELNSEQLQLVETVERLNRSLEEAEETVTEINSEGLIQQIWSELNLSDSTNGEDIENPLSNEIIDIEPVNMSNHQSQPALIQLDSSIESISIGSETSTSDNYAPPSYEEVIELEPSSTYRTL
ncbi:hypothetical protein BLOT_003801 [Blomia tropicalis]|nr:hypothetical protein BLOT_003801 [Blomia tropicalis]